MQAAKTRVIVTRTDELVPTLMSDLYRYAQLPVQCLLPMPARYILLIPHGIELGIFRIVSRHANL